MPAKKHRIIIDTNLWISFLLNKDFYKFDHLISDKKVILLFSQELLDEFIEVAARPKIKKYFAINDLEQLIEQISLHAEFIDVTSHVNSCRDPKDNFLLSIARDGKATHLITGDKDLLDIETFGNTDILSFTKYLTSV
ncbi:MAG: putative toxin-antitoxin system toxin component, PIN family [Bacteroidota bacterium]